MRRIAEGGQIGDVHCQPVPSSSIVEAFEGSKSLLQGGVRDVEVAMHSCLSADEGVDAPATGYPCPQTDGVQSGEHPEYLRRCQTFSDARLHITCLPGGRRL